MDGPMGWMDGWIDRLDGWDGWMDLLIDQWTDE